MKKQPKVKVITPDWPAPASVRAFTTTRMGGSSLSPYESLNMALHVGDNRNHVERNRYTLKQHLELPAEPHWLKQEHGTRLLNLDQLVTDGEADGSFTGSTDKICAVMTADCLPVLMCSSIGDKVAALHAGWRGLAAGIIEKGVKAMAVESVHILVWLGPAIGPENYEVGSDVFQAFTNRNPLANVAFTPSREGHWRVNLYQLARLEFADLGVRQIYGGNYCTFTDEVHFYSFRRDRTTGRMASLIWLQQETAY